MRYPLKTKKIVKIYILAIIVITGIFLLYCIFSIPPLFFTSLTEKQNPFYTSEEHRENLGIEIIKLSTEEEQKLHSMIEQTIMAGFKYYDTGDEKKFEKVEDLFLVGEYERVKRKIDSVKTYDRKGYKNYYKIPVGETERLEFSKPRKYKNLENRIGIMSFILGECSMLDYAHNCSEDPFYIFIFQKTDNEWKIERMKDFSIITKPRLDIQQSEASLIQALIAKTVKLSTEEEQKLHSMIEQTIMAGFKYYDTGDEKKFEKVEDLFLVGEYERVKRKIDIARKNEIKREGEIKCNIPVEILLEFSGLKRDGDLENRIGIMSLAPVEEPDFMSNYLLGRCITHQYYIFIFKQTDNELKIERTNWHYSPLKLHPDDILSEDNPFHYSFKEIKKEDSKK